MKWNIIKTNPFLSYKYSKKLNISRILSNVLINRNVKINIAKNILYNNYKLIEEPEGIFGANTVKEAILDSIKNNSDIYIFADYDVDGLTSGYIMKDFLENICSNHIEVYYPNRKEGYGLSTDFCYNLINKYKDKEKNVTVITVDNGITKICETDILINNNIKVIITDHHEVLTDELPNTPYICDAFINPNSIGKHLCGASIVWKICYLIAEELEKPNLINKYYPYIALATMADVMPMTPENSAIINIGLNMLNNNDYINNIKLLFNAIKPNTKITSKDLGWYIAPKINSCTRMDRLDVAQAFYEEKDINKLQNIIIDMIEIDSNRKKLVDKAIKETEKINFNKDKVCIFDSSKYTPGIAGIIAGRLTEKYKKPSIVIHKDNDGNYKGSVRSITGLNIVNVLSKEKDKNNIIDCGGHAEAAGLSLKENQVKDLKQSLNTTLDNCLIEQEPNINIDGYINLTDITTDVLEEITKLPYDNNYFTYPTFCLTNLTVAKTKTSSKNKNNICFTIQDQNKVVRDYWGWGLGYKYEDIGSPKQIDIIGKIEYGFGNSSNKATFIVTDIRKV